MVRTHSRTYRLIAARFAKVETGLESAGFAASSGEEFQQDLQTSVLHRRLELLPDADLRSTFVAKLADEAAHDDPPSTLDYRRLNLRALKPKWGVAVE